MNNKNYLKVYDSKTADIVFHVDQKLLNSLELKEIPNNGEQLANMIYNAVRRFYLDSLWAKNHRDSLFN